MHPVHRLVLASLAPAYRLLAFVRSEGRDNVPEGGAVLAFNHPTCRDPLAVQAAYRKPLYFLGKKEAFDLPVIGWMMRRLGGQIPLDRQGGGNRGALDEAVQRLRAGAKVALAPEGTRSGRGPLGRGRTGAVRLALQAGVPVVPVAVFPGRWGSRVVFGAPRSLARWRDQEDDPEAVRVATDHVMAAIAALLGETYDAGTAPDYAARRGFRPENAPDELGLK